MERIELLLPAGSPDALRAAVNNGADAVYLGLSKFNARQFADNFTQRNLADVIAYAHHHKVRVYVTLNTLIKNNEIIPFLEQASIAYQAKADALIIQDPNLAPILRSQFPGIELHLSTQATVTNRFAIPDELDRVILARELTLSEIEAIAQHHTVEVFVHGALCVSYSGQCLFSSMVGGRSGNRGMCAQPCRRLYNERYALSTKDLCLLPKLPELIKAGVHSFKVEGRMKSPLYVGTVARIYRKAIDSYYRGDFTYSDDDLRDLRQVFNRSFTLGHAFDETVIDSRKQSNRGLFIGTLDGDTVTLAEHISVGDVLKIEGRTETIREIRRDGTKITEATKDDVVKINLMRSTRPKDIVRITDAKLTVDLGEPIPPRKGPTLPSVVEAPAVPRKRFEQEPKLCVSVSSCEDLKAANTSGADIIYYPVTKDDIMQAKELCTTAQFFLSLPGVLRDSDVSSYISLIQSSQPDGVLIADRGLYEELQKNEAITCAIHLSYTFNCFNDYDVQVYAEQGAIPVISPELSFDTLRQFSDKRFMIYIHGQIPLMTIKGKIKGKALTDEAKREFPLLYENETTTLTNERPIGFSQLVRRLRDQGFSYFYCELDSDVAALVSYYRSVLDGKNVPFPLNRKMTRGHFENGVL